jgi:hypothetical protein
MSLHAKLQYFFDKNKYFANKNGIAGKTECYAHTSRE